MNSRNRDIRSVSGRLAWDLAGGQNAGSQLRDLRRDIQQREGLQYLQTLARRYWVSGTSFVEDKLRDVDLEITPTLLPPVPSNLLVAGNDQVPARPRRQVARYSRFQLQTRLHPSILAGLIPIADDTPAA